MELHMPCGKCMCNEIKGKLLAQYQDYHLQKGKTNQPPNEQRREEEEKRNHPSITQHLSFHDSKNPLPHWPCGAVISPLRLQPPSENTM